MAEAFCKIITKIRLKKTINPKTLPRFMGPGAPKGASPGIVADPRTPISEIVWLDSNSPKILHASITRTKNRGSIGDLVHSFESDFDEIIESLAIAGATEITATLDYHPLGEDQPVDQNRILKWKRNTYWGAVKKNFTTEISARLAPAAVVLIGSFFIGDKWVAKVAAGCILAIVTFFSTVLFPPIFSKRNRMERE